MEESNTSEKDGPATRLPRSLVRVPDDHVRQRVLERLFAPVAFQSGLPSEFLRRAGP
jgi:hypothetical protein